MWICIHRQRGRKCIVFWGGGVSEASFLGEGCICAHIRRREGVWKCIDRPTPQPSACIYTRPLTRTLNKIHPFHDSLPPPPQKKKKNTHTYLPSHHTHTQLPHLISHHITHRTGWWRTLSTRSRPPPSPAPSSSRCVQCIYISLIDLQKVGV